MPKNLLAFIDSENSTLFFVVDSAEITEDSNAKLKQLNELMVAYPNAKLLIEGHASSDGSMVYNQKLSERRAESVKNALLAVGVDASRLETVGYGETKPKADNKTAKGRSANRRVEFQRKVQIKVAE